MPRDICLTAVVEVRYHASLVEWHSIRIVVEFFTIITHVDFCHVSSPWRVREIDSEFRKTRIQLSNNGNVSRVGNVRDGQSIRAEFMYKSYGKIDQVPFAQCQ